MKEINYKEMGKRIQEKRLALKLTQEKLAEMIDVSPSYISEIERGSSICSLQVLVDIADVLNINLDFLVNDINTKNMEYSFSELLNDIPKNNHNLYISICKNVAKSFR